MDTRVLDRKQALSITTIKESVKSFDWVTQVIDDIKTMLDKNDCSNARFGDNFKKAVDWLSEGNLSAAYICYRKAFNHDVALFLQKLSDSDSRKGPLGTILAKIDELNDDSTIDTFERINDELIAFVTDHT